MSRDGAVLVEALVALTIITLVGVTALGLVAESISAHERLVLREVELEVAESLVIQMSLLDGAALTQRLGVREAGSYLIWVDRPEPNLFRVGISPVNRPEAELLATLFHRESESGLGGAGGP